MSDWSNGVLANGPKGYYRLSEASGLVANDSSSNGNNAALYGVAAYSCPGAIANDTDTSILFAPGGGLLLPNALTSLLLSNFTIEFLINIGQDWQYAALVQNNGITTFYLNNMVVPANGGGNNYTNIFVSQDFSFFGSVLAGGYLDEVAIFNYAFLRSGVANRWNLFQQAQQAPIQTVLFANSGYYPGIPGTFSGHEDVTINLTTRQVLGRNFLP